MSSKIVKLTQLYSPKKDPMRLALFMSGSGSNVRKILDTYIEQRSKRDVSFEPVFLFTDDRGSNALRIQGEYKRKEINIPLVYTSIRDYYNHKGCSTLSDMDVRAEYDAVQCRTLQMFSVDAVALAGYGWVVTPEICDHFVTVNVHPADLRVLGRDGKPKYRGLGWIPSAKAILAGENKVCTTVHLVTPQLDCGDLMGVSKPQRVPKEILDLDDRAAALGDSEVITQIKSFMKENEGSPDLEAITAKRFPLYAYARDCQEWLKVNGDWVVFPKVIDALARGNYAKDGKGNLYFDGVPIPDGFQFS